jgi:hypothetical protein
VLIVIDLADGWVSLDDPDDFSRFSVEIEGQGDLTEVVRQWGLGHVSGDGEHVVVDPVALRVLAGPAADRDWDEGLSGMCAYAAGRGWMEDDGVVAHIDRRDEAGSRTDAGLTGRGGLTGRADGAG